MLKKIGFDVSKNIFCQEYVLCHILSLSRLFYECMSHLFKNHIYFSTLNLFIVVNLKYHYHCEELKVIPSLTFIIV